MSLGESCFNSFFKRFTSSPPLPMIIPGRAVCIKTVTTFDVLVISILETPALGRRSFKYYLILTSSSNSFEEDVPARQRSGAEGDIIEGEFELLTPNKNESDPGSPSLPKDPERDNGGEEKGEAPDDNGTSSFS